MMSTMWAWHARSARGRSNGASTHRTAGRLGVVVARRVELAEVAEHLQSRHHGIALAVQTN
jgi:hypothetical protein